MMHVLLPCSGISLKAQSALTQCWVRGSFARSLNLDRFKGVPPEFNRAVKHCYSAQA